VIPYKIITTFKGKDLLDIRYEQLLDYVQPNDNAENAFRVILGDFVTTEDGEARSATNVSKRCE